MRRIIVSAALGALGLACGPATDRRGDPAARAPAADTAAIAAPADDRPVVLCFGTSLTAGLGLDPEEAYPAMVQRKVDSAGLDFRVANAGVSGETTADGLRRIGWQLDHTPRLAVLLLELGANDALRGQDLAAARRDLQQIIDRTRARFPAVRIVIAGMMAPPNLGERYTREFREMYPALARANDAVLIPFLLEGVGGHPGLNQTDGIHPNAAGARIVADNVWRVLEPVLRGMGNGTTSSPFPRRE